MEEMGRDCTFFTMMRHPIDRLVSAFYYCPTYRDVQVRPAKVRACFYIYILSIYFVSNVELIVIYCSCSFLTAVLWLCLMGGNFRPYLLLNPGAFLFPFEFYRTCCAHGDVFSCNASIEARSGVRIRANDLLYIYRIFVLCMNCT